ncbi:MAG: class I tRNA ligase family protein, partial [Candidatus Paceibacteria bacterium]
MAYDHTTIEKKWQEKWLQDATYRTSEDPKKEKKYVLDMFPYPSGEGLHVGHPKGYIATDIYSRHMRMRGFSVLHPMGWDAFGLPAENYALKHKVHPRVAVDKNIANFKEQLAIIGFDYDWSREINTTDPAYYHWTQWIFLKMLEHGLAFQSNEPINWCPSCMTGLANEDLDGAVCERCGTPVVKKNLPQWVLKITDYADRMLDDLSQLDWPEHIKEAQRNWIGRSEGVEIDFSFQGSEKKVTVFTTRPDTIFGATYLVLAPE